MRGRLIQQQQNSTFSNSNPKQHQFGIKPITKITFHSKNHFLNRSHYFKFKKLNAATEAHGENPSPTRHLHCHSNI